MKDSFKELTDREHVLLRPGTYIGSTSFITTEQPILTDSGLKRQKVKYVPALLKVINEIIDNSVDEAVRTNFKYANKIKVIVDDNSFEVEDNGRGIPVKPIDGGSEKDSMSYIPVKAFTAARAGSNFTDGGRETIGMNGVGSFCTNVFSNVFKAMTDDGKKRIKISCQENCGKIKATIDESKSNGTTVYVEPDFSRFESKTIDDTHKMLIKQRLIFLSATYQNIVFYFNKEKIEFTNNKKFLESFGTSYELLDNQNWFIAFYPSEEEFTHFTYVNGIYLPRGGNHIDNISSEICSRLRDKAVKKYSNIKPSDIKNKLNLVVFMSKFPDAKFDSQAKESLSSSVSDIKTYLNITGDDFDKLANKIWKNESIMGPILDFYQVQEELKSRKALDNHKVAKKVINDKYIPPTGEKERLFLAEGDSAIGGISASLGRRGNGYFALRGVPLNAYEVTQQKLLTNNEFKTIIDILQLDLSGKDKTISYDSVVIATDQDLDGFHIRGLLVAFFQRFAPWLLEQHKIVVLNTPVMITFIKGKPSRWWYNLNEYNKDISKVPLKKEEVLSYKKGLGSWKPEELSSFVKDIGINSMLFSVNITPEGIKKLEGWVGKENSDDRKESLSDKSFDLFSL
jgi:DNA topoisomerase-2